MNKLKMWQDRLSHNQSRWDDIAQRFDEREALIDGTQVVKACVPDDTVEKTPHVRNICFELIEAQVDTTIPSPKVTARYEEDAPLAKIIEDMIRDEMDRLPMELINDMMERTVPIQGGAFMLFEWDNTERTQSTIGDLTVQYLHPKQVVPQDGIFDNIESMDYIILKLPQTKEYIKNRYGIDMRDEGEQEPEARGVDGESQANDLVTQYVAYYRNDHGGIGRYSWVNDIEIEDIEDYQARQLRKCKKCGALEPLDSAPMDMPTEDGKKPGGEGKELSDDFDGEVEPKTKPEGVGKCPYCGGSFETEQQEYEEIASGLVSANGFTQIPMGKPIVTLDEEGNEIVANETVRVPYYKPDIYPIILQKSVSRFGQLLGDSDIDQIEDQQNTINRLWAKEMDLILRGGSFATLPADATVRTDNEDMKYYRVDDIADMQKFKVFDMQPDAPTISNIHALIEAAYEEARNAIGITDSYLGRRDSTATSGKAKEFAAQQSAGRLESKRMMKEAAYQQIFEAIFKFKLAYTDEPRPIISHNENGDEVREVFDRYDFLKQDAAGEWYWNDQFIFDVDSSAPLARDREAMWQETRMNFQQGAYGDPTQPQTLVFFWERMDELHYPGAAATKKHMREVMEQQMIQQQQMMQMQQQQMMMQQQAAAQQAEAQAVADIMKGGAKKDGSKKA